MKNNKGFIGVGLIVAIIVGILVVGGGAYYIGKTIPKDSNINDEKKIQPITDTKIDKILDDNSVVIANNTFAFDVYPKLIEKGKNTFFSPLSISSAFGMVYEGANGKTADEIQSVFHFPKDINTLRNSFSSITNEINKTSNEYQLSIANALWAQKDYKFLDEYLSNVDKYYGAKAMNVDFKNALEEASLAINKWIEDKTNNKIKNILPPKSLNYMTKLVLTNAIYFNGKWNKSFDKTETKAEIPFSTDSGNTVKVNMMQQKDYKAVFNYAENNNFQMLEMPYKGDKLSMIIILPKKNDLASFEKSFTLSNFNSWKKDLKKQRVDVFIPQFKFDAKYSNMETTLALMGMPTAFSNNADFSKMDGTKNLSISHVIHQAFVDVNEDGTEAAAATVVIMGVTSAGPGGPVVPTFYANHPFIFMIQDTANGNILFMGRVLNPNLKN